MADWADLVDQQESRLASKVSDLNIGQKSGGGAQASAPSSASGATANAATANAATASASTASASTASASAASAGAANTNTNANTNNASNSATEEETEDDKAPSKEEESLLRKLIQSRLLNTKADLEVLRQDPNSPLYSVKSFDKLNLKPELLKGVYNMGFNAPSKIQEKALPALLQNPPRNMIAQSQSGTGKTAAFVLAMLSRVDTSKPYTQCLCLAPTYELALQIGEVVKKMASFMPGVIIKYAVRGERVARGQKLEAHIVIGTPGTLMDWALKFKAIDLKKVEVFVLDEADVMIATQGHQDQSVRIRRNLREDCQMLLFSATYDDEVMKFAESIVPGDPFIIRLRRDEESLDNIRQYYIECESTEAKYNALANIYGSISIGQSMIFCRTRKTANWLAEKMVKDGHAVGLLSGELEIEQRAAIINRFRSGKEKVLITTNVSARGIDVEQVTVVVNFDLPTTQDRRPDFETYLHRIGRTGRFGKQGLAINMVDGSSSMRTLRAIEDHFGKPIIKVDAEDMDALENLST